MIPWTAIQSWQGLPGIVILRVAGTLVTTCTIQYSMYRLFGGLSPTVSDPGCWHAAGRSLSRAQIRFDVGVPVKENLSVFDAQRITSHQKLLHRPAATRLDDPDSPPNLISMNVCGTVKRSSHKHTSWLFTSTIISPH